MGESDEENSFENYDDEDEEEEDDLVEEENEDETNIEQINRI